MSSFSPTTNFSAGEAVPMISPAFQIDKVPMPSHRHAAPSGPWPWMNLTSEVDSEQLNSEGPPVPPPCDHSECEGKCWKGYPQSRFPNWTPKQVARSKITEAVEKYDRNVESKLYVCDVDTKGLFTTPPSSGLSVTEETKEKFWEDFLRLKRERDDIRVRSLFIENMSGPVLQMLGARYNVEPFFFSSSLNWIPSRYQEDHRPKEGDHITITLTFLTTMPKPNNLTRTGTFDSLYPLQETPRGSTTDVGTISDKDDISEQVIDTQAPLSIASSDKILLLDLLAVHMVRQADSSTIISYHPTRTSAVPASSPTAQPLSSQQPRVSTTHTRGRHTTTIETPPTFVEQMSTLQHLSAGPSRRGSRNTDAGTTAARLHQRVRFAGQSVYWQNIFTKSRDPTFVLLTFLWHALYAWDEALEVLYSHVCYLESRVMVSNDMRLTKELHVIRAHHLHYSALLDDFKKSVEFVRDTANPAMDADDVTEEERERSGDLLKRECGNLLSELERLKKGRKMQDQRLKNVMNLVFSSVNIEDSKRMQRLTEATVRDSAAMKQIAYLTMIFLPASFVAAAFGMNIRELIPDAKDGTHMANGTLAHYVEAAIAFTVLTIWVIVSFQSKYFYDEKEAPPFWKRLAWPYGVAQRFLASARTAQQHAVDALL
ncbi:hypothetical protein HGRIS_012396 [Hohenbuehelia grisea]|uniref:Uncharacterized protein n=1 Tax=Hohenbuehelia grisea TaxID=104357 RepID=A0ABR3IS38_9AGAR